MSVFYWRPMNPGIVEAAKDISHASFISAGKKDALTPAFKPINSRRFLIARGLGGGCWEGIKCGTIDPPNRRNYPRARVYSCVVAFFLIPVCSYL